MTHSDLKATRKMSKSSHRSRFVVYLQERCIFGLDSPKEKFVYSGEIARSDLSYPSVLVSPLRRALRKISKRRLTLGLRP